MRRAAVALTALLALTSSSAHADGTNAAEDYFQRAKALMQNKATMAEACPLLAASYRLDPAGGTLQNLAVCYEKTGQWASAYARFQELKTLSKNATPPRNDRVKIADDQLAIVTPKITHVFFVLPSDVVDRATATIDDVKYEKTALGAGIALDPGPHAFTVAADGKKPFAGHFDVSAPGEQRVSVPALTDLPPPPVVDERHDDAELKEKERERAESEHRLRRTGYFVGGGGVVVGLTGGVFGVFALRKNNDGRSLCERPAGTIATDINQATGRCIEGSPTLTKANDAKSSALVFANVANIMIGVGVIGVAAGVYLILVRTSPDTAARLAPTLNGIGGTF